MGIQPISGIGHEEQAADLTEGRYSELLAQSMKKQERQTSSITEMIRDARERADAQREKFKMAKGSPRYGDAPLEAYARLRRAKTQAQVGSAAGYARSRIAQLEAAQRSDPDHADQIKAAISQLKKAVSRASQKKKAISQEQLAQARQKRMAKEKRHREEQRIRQQLRRAQSMRAIRESGYSQEADIANRFADQISATKMELRAQAEKLGVSAQASIETAVQGYSSAAQTAQAVSEAVPAPQVDVQA